MVFINKGSMRIREEGADSYEAPLLSSKAYETARTEAPGWDIYHLEQEWRDWMADGGLDAPKNPEQAFVGFCRKWFQKRGYPG